MKEELSKYNATGHIIKYYTQTVYLFMATFLLFCVILGGFIYIRNHISSEGV